MEMLKTKCPICDSVEDYTVMYKSNFSFSDINLEIFSARRLPDSIHYQIVRCNHDGLVRSNPICNDISIETLYKKSKFNYGEQVDNLKVSYLKVLNRVLSTIGREAKILEIGCGNGFILSALYDQGYTHLYGVEPSQDAALKSDERIKSRITTSILKEGLYENGSFDFIFFFQTLDHIQDPAGFLSICYQLLSQGGFILALNHDVESLSARVLKEKSPIIDIEHTCLYSKKTIHKIFCKAGFSPMEVFSPRSIISLRYLIWLLPLPKTLKQKLLNLKGKFSNFLLKQRLSIALGNLCIIAKKPLNH
jgi:SAM-dependent methyltransferase